MSCDVMWLMWVLKSQYLSGAHRPSRQWTYRHMCKSTSLYHEPVSFSLGQSQGTLWGHLAQAFMCVCVWLSWWNFPEFKSASGTFITMVPESSKHILHDDDTMRSVDGFGTQARDGPRSWRRILLASRWRYLGSHSWSFLEGLKQHEQVVSPFSSLSRFPFKFSGVEHLLPSRSSGMLSETLRVVCWCFLHLPTEIRGLPCLVSNNLRIFRHSGISGHRSLYGDKWMLHPHQLNYTS